MQEFINNRALGSTIPISLPTSVAIESLLLSDSRVIKEYPEVWINIKTLVRNLLSSLDKETQQMVSDAELTNVIIDEIEIIEATFKQYQPTKFLVFYSPNYDNLSRRYPNAKYRKSTTERQLFQKALFENTYRNISLYYKDSKIKNFDIDLKPIYNSKAILLTHFAADLTSETRFDKILLLESHTGKLKDRNEWYTKLSTDQKDPSIPFRMCMLTIFGDSEIFSPQPASLRNAIVEVARQSKWNPMTTLERMRVSIGFMKDRELKQELLKFIH